MTPLVNAIFLKYSSGEQIQSEMIIFDFSVYCISITYMAQCLLVTDLLGVVNSLGSVQL